MKKTKEMINEERRFLRLCSQPYKDMIRKKRKMTMNDFNRFHCVLTTLRMEDYALYFCVKLFPELLSQVVEYENERRCADEKLFLVDDNIYAYVDQYENWLYEFWEQMPLESQKKKYQVVFGIRE